MNSFLSFIQYLFIVTHATDEPNQESLCVTASEGASFKKGFTKAGV
jgi:hypothetical protein